jgi:hypothetical protein
MVSGGSYKDGDWGYEGSSGQFELSLPDLPSGTYDLMVGTDTITGAVTIETGTAPVISGVSPSYGSPTPPVEDGMSIDVQGSPMYYVTAGTINNEPADCSSGGATDAYCTVPSDLASGSYSLVLTSTFGASEPYTLAVQAEGSPTVSGVTFGEGGGVSEGISQTVTGTSDVEVSGTDIYNPISCEFVDGSGADYPPLYPCSYFNGELTMYLPGPPPTWGSTAEPTTLAPGVYDIVITTSAGRSTLTEADQITLTSP